jgi:hypothetical protein
MHLVDGEILIATLDRPDFQRAKSAVEGFAEWASYEDYQCDRDDAWISGRESDGGWPLLCSRRCPRSYWEWLECIRNNPSDALLNAYAGLLLETDKPRTPTFADDPLLA